MFDDYDEAPKSKRKSRREKNLPKTEEGKERRKIFFLHCENFVSFSPPASFFDVVIVYLVPVLVFCQSFYTTRRRPEDLPLILFLFYVFTSLSLFFFSFFLARSA